MLWEPSEEAKANANITRFMRWLADTRRLRFDDYHQLWRWSVSDLDGFWSAIWHFFEVKAHSPYSSVLAERRMPGAKWFPGAKLNYAEHALSRRDAHPALVSQSEGRPLASMTYGELHDAVASVAEGLRSRGVRGGDRVVAYMPSIPESVVAFLATASLGAIWSSCSPEFGTRTVLERFRQIGPAVLFAVDGYRYGGRDYPRLDEVAEIQRNLPTLRHTVIVPYLEQRADARVLPGAISWSELRSSFSGELVFEPVPFEHPLWVLYSSGTTGLPKPIVHGHGGILLEHMKTLSLHMDVTEDDRFFWYTTTGWMMWNLLMGGLLLGATVLLYDGDAGYPDMDTLWRFADETRMTYFGASAAYVQACMKAGVRPSHEFDLLRLRGVGSTGAPLIPEASRWIYENVGNVHLGSYSGGTDMCTGFVGPCPLLPVRAGEIQCRCLGNSVKAYDQRGRSLVDEVGELVITQPAPSMPLHLWGDSDGSRYRESYFDMFPGVWRHGDWIKVTSRGSCVISGRSDSTLNRAGVRMGTSEFYRVVEEMDDVLDSLIVQSASVGEDRLLLFLVPAEGVTLDDVLRDRIRTKLRRELSPRHTPDEIYAIQEVPRTLNGKKLEVPVRRILAGTPPEEAVSEGALSNPDALRFFIELARDVVA